MSNTKSNPSILSAPNHKTRTNGSYDDTTKWSSPTGASLAVYIKRAKSKPIAAVHVNHGLADHAGRYARFAEHLSAAGFHVYAQDHRGHGATRAQDTQQGVFADGNGWEAVLEDIAFVNGEIRRLYPGLPIIEFGHSMGAMLVYNLILRRPGICDAAAIWKAAMSKSAAAPVLNFILGAERLLCGRAAPSMMTKLTFGSFNGKFKPNQTSADWLTKDVAEALAYENDPDCGWPASVSMWRELSKGIAYGASDKGLEALPKDLPIYLLGGDADPSVMNGKGVMDLSKRIKSAGLSKVKTELREGGRHEALNEPEPERNAVMDGFVEWAKSAIQ